jgi:2-polyprenyl-6-methoxyphenol hydroxylase-like FAD-dependent oxidoreductase
MKTDNEVDVIVVGGGPVGLTLACELRLAGLRVTLLERRAEPVPQSRALTMHGRTVEMLALRGVAERFIARGMPIPSGHFAALGTRLDFSVIDTTFPFTLFIPQSVTEQLLEAWALELGVDLRRRAVVERLVDDGAGATVHGVRDGAPFALSAAYLVGADGARSLVRQHAGIAFDGLPPTKTAMLGDVRLSAPPDSPALALDNAAGGLMLVPLGGGLHRLIVVDAERSDQSLSTPVTLDELAESARRVAGRDFGLHAPAWLSRFSNETRLAARYRRGRILLAGDAAHIHLPAGGQGMNVGMQDAMNLGWKLAGVLNGHAAEALLDSYHGERHAVGEALYHNTLAQSALMMNSFDAAGQALRRLFGELLRIPALNAALAQDLSAFGVRYPAPLSAPVAGWSAWPEWTGRRLPNWTLRGADGGRFALFDALRGGRWLLLRPPGQVAAEGGAGYRPALAAAWCEVATAWPEAPPAELDGVAALLIRPDGHVDQAVARDASTGRG